MNQRDGIRAGPRKPPPHPLRLRLRRQSRRLQNRLAGVWLQPVSKAVRRQRLTYLSNIKLRRLERVLQRLRQRDVSGDFVEFGVALGGSAIVVAQAALAQGRRFHGFDVFGMIPPPTSKKDGKKARDRYKLIADGKAKGIGGEGAYYGYGEGVYERVVAAMERFGVAVDGERVRLHRGLFEDTVPASRLGPIAFAHVDCDWYDPVAFALATVADRLASGGAILIDDYHDYRGAKLAVEEFLAQRSDYAVDLGANLVLWKL